MEIGPSLCLIGSYSICFQATRRMRETDDPKRAQEGPGMSETREDYSSGDLETDEATSNGHVKILSLADILAADDLPEKVVDLPEWGGAVRVRALKRGDIKKAYRLSTSAR